MMRRLSTLLGFVVLAGCDSPTANVPSVLLEVTASSVTADLVTGIPVPRYDIRVPYRVENQGGIAVRVAQCGFLHAEKLTGGAWVRFWPIGGQICTLSLGSALQPGEVREGTMTITLNASEMPATDITGSFRLVSAVSAAADMRRQGQTTSNTFQIVADS